MLIHEFMLIPLFWKSSLTSLPHNSPKWLMGQANQRAGATGFPIMESIGSSKHRISDLNPWSTQLNKHFMEVLIV
jgi:hypothetical protein